MKDEMDDVLRRSCEEVDRTRKRQWIYLAVAMFCLILFMISIIKTAENIGDFRLVTTVLVGVILLALTNVLVVLGLSLFINKMTRKILKAIELISAPRN